MDPNSHDNSSGAEASYRAFAPVLRFGPFSLHRAQRALVLGDRSVELASSSFDVLLALLDHADRSVDVGELGIVSTASRGDLEVSRSVHQINAVLAGGSSAHYVAQYGPTSYRFMGPLHALAGSDASWVRGQLVVGREEAARKVSHLLAEHRLLTIVGPGGIGKTTVAHTLVAAMREADARRTICFVDLAPLSTADAVARATATALGISPAAEDLLARIRDHVHGRETLFVLDNCEHLVGAASELAEALLQATGTRVLATSREALRAKGEASFQLPALEVPALEDSRSVESARQFSAVRMFAHVAARDSGTFQLDARSVEGVCEACRRLDGMPLALEIAAAWVGKLGLDWLLRQIEAGWLGSGQGAAFVRGRHSTLHATLAWSHSLLDDVEKAVFRRIAVFRSAFPLDSAVFVASADSLAPADALQGLLGLAGKSLLSVVPNERGVEYRLLETTRTYALEVLRSSGEADALRRRHAEDCCARLAQAEAQWAEMSAPNWMSRHARLIEDARAGLDWAAATEGQAQLGARLLMASLPLAGRLSLLREYLHRLECALRALRAGSDRDIRLEYQISAALGAQMLNQTLPVDEILSANQRVQDLAVELRDESMDGAAWSNLWLTSVTAADYPRATHAADRQLAWARRHGDDVDLRDARRQVAYSRHFMGRHDCASMTAAWVLANTPPNSAVKFYSVNQIDHRVAMRIVLARAQWLQGKPVQACDTVTEALRYARDDRPTSLCQALAFAGCPIALWNGDEALCDEWAAQLRAHANSNGLPLFEDWAVRFANALARRRGEPQAPLPRAPTAMQQDALATLDANWVGPEVVARVAQGQVGWCAAEVLRVRGELAAATGDVLAAHEYFALSLRTAAAQGELAWQLRTATSWAALLGRAGRTNAARDTLSPVYRQFTEGLTTHDLMTARAVLDSL